ncbi:hypothetical protein AAHE18_06G030600 [Arachis hypogaea]|nr:Transposon Ty3-G Gag-Pol polyprotein [Arachis hypogaea]
MWRKIETDCIVIEKSKSTERVRRKEENRRVELPMFDGDDVCGWLVQIERYFRLTHITSREKLDYVMLAFHGEALTWLEWWEENTPFFSWRRFKQDLLRRFQPGAV